MVLFVIRNKVPYSLFFDSLLTVCLVMTYLKWRRDGVVQRALVFLGKHSMNIFLFHTFIYYFYFYDWVYYSRNPLLIFLTLLLICIALSLFLERVKEFLRYNKLCELIMLRLKCKNLHK